MTKLTLDDVNRQFNPAYEIQTPQTVLLRDLPSGCNRYIITAAQNGTPVHSAFWRSLKVAATYFGAQILVIPLRYKNPTSQWTGSQRNQEWWAPEVRDYLWNVRHKLNRNLTLLADLKIQPTAETPLTGADAISHAASGIIGHTKVQLKCIATPSAAMAKILTTTGACTVENYTDSRAGRIGAFHHSLSALIVEVEGPKFFMRHMHFDSKSGGCIDLDTWFGPSGYRNAPRPLGLIMGDTHVDSICPKVKQVTFGSGGIVETLKPKHLIWHDLLDSYSCNPHHKNNPFNVIAKRSKNADDVRAEMTRAIDFIFEHTPKDVTSVIVGSNHNDFLRRWIIDGDWKNDPVNAEFYLETALAMVRGTKLTEKGTEYPDPFMYWAEKANLPNTILLNDDESFELGGVELGMHGNLGPNGARGSRANLKRIGIRSIIGHSHTPGIDEGCYQAGTSTRLRLEYNKGPSSWLNAHVLLHADGKRQLLVIVDGKYRL
jgi:hypothetical protein